MKRFLFLLLFAAVAITACTEKEKTTASGLRYTIHKKGTGKEIKLGDTVQIHVILMNQKDSVLQSTYVMGGPQGIIVDKPKSGSDPLSIFPGLHEGDSLTVKMTSDSFLNLNPQAAQVFKKGEEVQIRFKILKVLTHADIKKMEDEMRVKQEQQRAEGMRMMQESMLKDSATIQQYLKDNNLTNAQRTPDGVYYVITKKGTGRLPKPNDIISANYKGMLLNGKVFDQSRETPFEFPLGAHQVIPGWESGFSVLPEGSKATLIIPSHLAYGPQGAGNDIPPFSVLRFDVELVKIKAGGPGMEMPQGH